MRKQLRLTLRQAVDGGRQRGERGRETFEIHWGKAAPGTIRRRRSLEELAHRHPERPREMNQDLRAGIHLRQFDTAEILVVQASTLREVFLREIPLETQTAYLSTKWAEDRLLPRRCPFSRS